MIRLSGVCRDYQLGDCRHRALANVDLKIRTGEYVAIVGASGSGKSTLMNILGCLDRATEGVYYFAGHDTSRMTVDELAILRRERIGVVFQHYNLIPELTALDNVELPAVYAGASAARRRSHAIETLRRLGLGDCLSHRPLQLSGGNNSVSASRAPW